MSAAASPTPPAQPGPPGPPGPIDIRRVITPEQVAQAKALVVEMVEELGLDLSFQGWDKELATFPAKYQPPHGLLLLASIDGEPAGCVAYQNLGDGHCEMKRLYVRPAFRGRGISRALVERLASEARTAHFTKMVWDTLETMAEALALYRRLGAREVPPYYDNPLPGVLYFGISL